MADLAKLAQLKTFCDVIVYNASSEVMVVRSSSSSESSAFVIACGELEGMPIKVLSSVAIRLKVKIIVLIISDASIKAHYSSLPVFISWHPILLEVYGGKLMP